MLAVVVSETIEENEIEGCMPPSNLWLLRRTTADVIGHWAERPVPASLTTHHANRSSVGGIAVQTGRVVANSCR